MTFNSVVKVVTLALVGAACGAEVLPTNTAGAPPRTTTTTRPRLGPNTGLLQGSLGPVRNMDGAATVMDLSPDGTNTVLLTARNTAGAVVLELQTGFPTSDPRFRREATYTFGANAAYGPSFSQQIRVLARADADPEHDANTMSYRETATMGVMMVSSADEASYRRIDLVLEFPGEAEEFSATFLLPGAALAPIPGDAPPPPAATTSATIDAAAWMKGSVGHVVDMNHQALAQSEATVSYGGYTHVTVTARDPNRGMTMSVINIFVPLNAESLTPGRVYALGAGIEYFSVLGCSDRDSQVSPGGVEYDEPADDGSIVVDQGPTPDTRILNITSTHLNGPGGRTDMLTQLSVQLAP